MYPGFLFLGLPLSPRKIEAHLPALSSQSHCAHFGHDDTCVTCIEIFFPVVKARNKDQKKDQKSTTSRSGSASWDAEVWASSMKMV